MTNIKTLRGQTTPHRRLGISLFFLIPDGVVDSCEVRSIHPTLVTECDIRKPDILYRMTGQTCDRTAHRTCIANLEIIKVNAIDCAHMVDGNEFGNRVFIAVTTQSRAGISQFVAASAITQTDENGRFRTLDGEVRHVHILHHAAIDNLQ